jgi:translation initiation factor IF-2
MAKLHEETVVITVSKLLKNDEEADVVLTADTIVSLEAVVQELAGAGSLVEITVA